MFNIFKNELLRHQDYIINLIFKGIENSLTTQEIEEFNSNYEQSKFQNWLDSIKPLIDKKGFKMENHPFIVYNRLDVFVFLYKIFGMPKTFNQLGEISQNPNWLCTERKFIKRKNLEILKITTPDSSRNFSFQFGDEYIKYDYRSLNDFIVQDDKIVVLKDIGFYD